MLTVATSAAQRNLKDTKIIAPISGTVTTVTAREGAIGMGVLFVVEDTGLRIGMNTRLDIVID